MKLAPNPEIQNLVLDSCFLLQSQPFIQKLQTLDLLFSLIFSVVQITLLVPLDCTIFWTICFLFI